MIKAHCSTALRVLSAAAFWSLLPSPGAIAQTTEPTYHIRLEAPQTQMVEIDYSLPDVGPGALDVMLPAWRPGRYAILDPAGTVREVVALTARGRELPIRKIDKATWRIDVDARTDVRVSYRVYANSLRDRTRHVDDTHAFLSGSSVFLYAPEYRDRLTLVKVTAPDGWRTSSGLEPSPDHPELLLAPSYDVLVDTPLEIGLHEKLEFEVDGVPHEIVLWPTGAHYDDEVLTEDFAKIVAEQARIFGDMPYQRYVFLTHVGAGAGGGTEHLNSTIMQTRSASLEGSLKRNKVYRRFLGLVAHEMFHTWNVKQLRPAQIAPYDYQKENYSELFWVSEGTTSYYADLTLLRTGLRKEKEVLENIGDVIDGLRRRPGNYVQSAAASSFDAWIKFNNSTPDDVNSTVSFYGKGQVISLLLDLEIRRASANDKSLDDVMRALYRNFPLEDGGFTEGDLLATLERISGRDWGDFFASYVHGVDELPLERALPVIGLELYFKADRDDDDDSSTDDDTDDDTASDPEARLEADLGLRLRDSNGNTIVSSVLSDGAAYSAGILANDEIVAVDGRHVAASELDDRLDLYQPGDTVRVHLLRTGRLKQLDVTLGERRAGKFALRRVREPTDEQKAGWRSWAGQPWPKSKAEAEGGDQ